MGGIIGDEGEARVLVERGGAWDGEEVAMEVDGGGERGGELEEGGEGEKGNGATVAIGHDALDRTVVGDSGVAELHDGGGQVYASRLVGRRGFGGEGNVEVEEPHGYRRKSNKRTTTQSLSKIKSTGV